MLVYFEDLLVEHLAGAISSVGTEWQKGNRMERKKQNMLTMQKAKTKKNKLKIRQKKGDDISDVWVRELKNMEKQIKILRGMVDGVRMA